jgi:putative acetyltransferase
MPSAPEADGLTGGPPGRPADVGAIILRDAVDGDAAGLIALIGACFAEYPGCILAVDAEMPELRAIATATAAAGGRFWVAEHDGAVVGSVGLKPGPRPGAAELVKLYVAPSARRRGLGGRLVATAEAEARANGAESLLLFTDTRFTDAHRLYERQGFVRRPGRRWLFDLSNSVEYAYVKLLDSI